jgi:mevalonate kinase
MHTLTHTHSHICSAKQKIHTEVKGDVVPSDSERNMINKWGFEGERVLHGNPSGVDNTCCTYGGVVVYQKGKQTQFMSKLPAIPILLTNTLVSRNTKQLVAKVKVLKDKYPEAVDPLIHSIDQICLRFVALLRDNSGSSVSKAFLDTTHDLIKVNQALLVALGVGHEAIDRIVSAGDTHNFASKLTGAGGGGCVVTFLPPATSVHDPSVKSFERTMKKSGFECLETTIGQDGVLLHAYGNARHARLKRDSPKLSKRSKL